MSDFGTKDVTLVCTSKKCKAVSQQIPYVDVIVIGNGPSGICLSYLLTGHWPYYTGSVHSNEYLHKRLQVQKDQPLILQDLKFLSDDLEGRSSNPVSLLFDTLSNPDADLGSDSPSLLSWKHHPKREISHLVLGKGEEGGIWQILEGQMKTLSLRSWMELPDMSFEKWLLNNRRFDDPERFSNRAQMEEVSSYYSDYVKEKDLGKHFRNHSTVTSVQQIQECSQNVDDESGEECIKEDGQPGLKSRSLWLVCGHRTIEDKDGNCRTEDFCYRSLHLVLATGTSDCPNSLRVPEEDLPHVHHSLLGMEQWVLSHALLPESDPVIVIGAGLSAADAVLYLLNRNIPVIHIVRRESEDPQIVFRQLPPKLYPEYDTIYRLMQGTDKDDRYRIYSTVDVVQFTKDRQVIVKSRQSGVETVLESSCVAILIGSKPDLSFLPRNITTNLGIVPGMAIHSQHNPIDVDPYTYQSNRFVGLYAMGPLVGDNLVRFLRGGALGIVSHLWQKRETT